ncbi:MAG TPA: hypothetical protein VNA26_04430 [Chitinophagaceae bacterium]|nr:hypothetical protein [Chitinophagaceae bacterium]
MHASAQTDSTQKQDSVLAMFPPTISLKNVRLFPNHSSSTIPYTSRGYMPVYQKVYSPFYQKNTWQTVFEITGHTLLSIIAHKNNYNYNYVRPR